MDQPLEFLGVFQAAALLGQVFPDLLFLGGDFAVDLFPVILGAGVFGLEEGFLIFLVTAAGVFVIPESPEGDQEGGAGDQKENKTEGNLLDRDVISPFIFLL